MKIESVQLQLNKAVSRAGINEPAIRLLGRSFIFGVLPDKGDVPDETVSGIIGSLSTQGALLRVYPASRCCIDFKEVDFFILNWGSGDPSQWAVHLKGGINNKMLGVFCIL